MTTITLAATSGHKSRLPGFALITLAAILLNGCSSGENSQQTAAPLASGTTILQMEMPAMPAEAAAQLAQPAFHIAPVLLNEPDGADIAGNSDSAHRQAHVQFVPEEFNGMSSRRLTVKKMEAARNSGNFSEQNLNENGTATPMGSGTAVATYTPAQIRTAYNLPPLPSGGTTLSAAQAAQLGAGQTIYLIDAMNDPNVVAELAAFNQQFGLPGCTTTAVASNAALPLSTAPASGCQFSVVYNTAGGTMTATVPAYDSGWATEIALDVQWAHATAPLARLILIEAPDASLAGLEGAIKLANTMGPGIVSMSFGSSEGNWTASVDAIFASPNMSYLAATGDSGAGVQWPAVSPNVVAVSGTTLSYSGSAARSETAWADTGGGISAYTPTPSYQSNAVPGMGNMAHRSVADVSFNADPATGQYLAVIAKGSSTVNWLSAGGTSLSTPQWAGVIAVANAQRALAAKPALGLPNTMLYGTISTVPGTYASSFADITKGADGTCSTCSAKVGYDQVTGLGTPNVTSIISALTGTTAALAPVVTPATINGKAGTALSFTVSVTASDTVSYTLTDAPSGMSISSSGIVTWTTPLAGNYSVTVTAKDSKNGLSGQGVYTVCITALSAPVVTAATISGKTGTALSFTVSATSPDTLSYTLSGAPSGMTISSTGVVNWASPVAGTYAVTVTAKDTKTGLSGSAVYTVNIAAVATTGPVISASAMTGVVGKPLAGPISFSDPGVSSLSVSISGIPIGMMFSVSGMTVTANWASPVLGTYSLKVTAQDSAGHSATVTIPVTITAK